MATTSFQGGGYPGRPYGSFAGKAADAGDGPHNPGRITTLWPYGGSGRLYGSFAGKEESDAVVVVAPAREDGAGSGKYRPGAGHHRLTEDDALLYLEGLKAEFRALKAQAVHVEEVKEEERPAPLPQVLEAKVDAIAANLEALEAMEREQEGVAARLALTERVIAQLEALEARIREEEEILLLH